MEGEQPTSSHPLQVLHHLRDDVLPPCLGSGPREQPRHLHKPGQAGKSSPRLGKTLVMGAGAFAASPPLLASEICAGQITGFTDTLQRGSPASGVHETWAASSGGRRG